MMSIVWCSKVLKLPRLCRPPIRAFMEKQAAPQCTKALIENEHHTLTLATALIVLRQGQSSHFPKEPVFTYINLNTTYTGIISWKVCNLEIKIIEQAFFSWQLALNENPDKCTNGSFLSCLLLKCQNESLGEAIHLKMRSIHVFSLIYFHTNHISTRTLFKTEAQGKQPVTSWDYLFYISFECSHVIITVKGWPSFVVNGIDENPKGKHVAWQVTWSG